MSGLHPTSKILTIGVLALQGAFEVHAGMLRSLGAEPVLIRRPDQLIHPDGAPRVDGLILPGGESSTFLRHLERDGFFDILNNFVRQTPTFGTCAGSILLATDVTNPTQRSFAALDITVERNAYGRQLDSVILREPTALGGDPLEMVFIRAPRNYAHRSRCPDPRFPRRQSRPRPPGKPPCRHLPPRTLDRHTRPRAIPQPDPRTPIKK